MLLQNGSYGYAESEKIIVLPYVVTASSRGTGEPNAPDSVIKAVIEFAMEDMLGHAVTKELRAGGFVHEVFARAGADAALSEVDQGAEVHRQSGDRGLRDATLCAVRGSNGTPGDGSRKPAVPAPGRVLARGA